MAKFRRMVTPFETYYTVNLDGWGNLVTKKAVANFVTEPYAMPAFDSTSLGVFTSAISYNHLLFDHSGNIFTNVYGR